MSLTISLAAVLFGSTSGAACEVTLVNSSTVDLSLSADGRDVAVAPGERATVPATWLSAVDFGAVNHQFAVAPALSALCPAGRAVEIEARSDGLLWLRDVDQQPDGMPLEPVFLQDLTGAPPNNSFKPNSLRKSA